MAVPVAFPTSYAAVQGKGRSILFYVQSDGALAYGASSSYGAETKDTKYIFDTVKISRKEVIYPKFPRISAVSWETDDGKEEVSC